MALEIGVLRIDEPRSLALVRGEPLPLRPLDVRILAHLARDPGRAVTRQALAEQLWGASSEVDPRTVDTSVVRIRRALDGLGDAIVTIRRVGYRLDPGRLVS